MDPRRHPDLVDKLAAEYAVGTLRAGARRRFEQILRHDDAVRATVERWQRYLADLPALQPATAPLPEILCRVEVQLGWREPTPARKALWQRIWQGTGFWRGATAVAAVKAGALDYLPKPADADDVAKALLAQKDHSPAPPENPMSADRVRWEHIQRVYELCGHNVSETARRLNMHRRTLQRILAKRAPR